MSVNVGTAVGYLDLDTSKFKNALKDAQSQLSSFSDKSLSAGEKFTNLGSGLKSIGSTLSTSVTLPLVGIGTAAVATAATFEKSMDNVAALSGATGKDLEDLTNLAKKMGETTQFSASEAADALGYMALAGWDTNQSMNGLPGILDLAASSGMGLAEASDMVTDYLSAFGEEADQAGRMADVLAKAQASSNTTAQGLGEAFKNCAVNANAFGLDIEQTTAVLGKLADQGLKGSEAGTALNAVFRDMSSKMKDGAIAIGDTNVKITDAQGNFRSLADIVTDVEKATDGLSESEKMVALQSTFTADSIKAMGILMNTGGDSINDFTNELYGAEGAASKMASAMNDNLSGQLTLLKSALEGAAISIGEALMPMIKGLVAGINELVNWFNSLNPSIQQTIIVIAGIAAAIGPVLIVIGQMSIGIGALITFFGKAKLAIIAFGTMLKTNLIANLISFNMYLSTTVVPALTAFGTFITGTIIPALTATAFSVGAITVPVWAVIAAIAALIAIGVLLYNNWDTIKAKCSEVWNSIVETVTTVWNNIKTSTLEIWSNITSTLSSAWDSIKSVTQPAVNFIKDIVSSAWSFISTTTSTIWNSIKGIIQSVWELIKSIVNLGVEVIKLAITVAWNAIKTVTTTAWNGIKSVIQTVWNTIKPVVTSGANAVKTVVTTVFNAVKSVVTTIWNSIKTVIQTAWNGIKSVVSTGANLVRSTISSVFSTLTNIMTAPFRAAQSVISGILGGITSAINKVTSGIKSVTSLFRTVEPPQMEVPDNSEYMEVDYSKVRFNYANAKETTLSDVMARNNSMTDTIKTFSNNIKSDNNINSSFLNDFKETVKGLSNTAKEIIVPVVLDGKEIARVIAPYTDNVNGNRINLSERGLVL